MYNLPQLPYSYDALEPYIDAKTMELHHSKHHQGYVDKLNKAIMSYSHLAEKKIEDLLRELPQLDIPEQVKVAIRNHGGGHANHSLFWQIMGPEKKVDEKLLAEIEETFGGIREFKEKFTETALSHFGSGWAWLVRDEQGKLQVYSTLNQDSPLLQGHTPIIGLDVWEHAYYLKYQNRRAEYIENWWQVLTLL